MTVFFTADTHFSHRRIIELADRPFASVAEMDAALVDRWNDVVRPDDVVYHLGDVALGTIEDSLALESRLHGTKHLLAGDHDRCFVLARRSRGASPAEWEEVYRQAGFASVTDGAEPLDHVMSSGRRVVLSHFPSGRRRAEDQQLPDVPDRWEQVRPPLPEGGLLLHGHVHDSWLLRPAPQGGGAQEVNVGVDVWGFAPVSEAQVEDLLAGSSGTAA